jgi:uncharacterized protein
MADPLPPSRPATPAALPLKGGGDTNTGRLAENIVYFARALRAAGIPVGPGAVLDALEALKVAGVGTRDDFYWTLHAVFVKRSCSIRPFVFFSGAAVTSISFWR